MQYIINDEDGGKRLDVFLADKSPDSSRSQLQKLIKAGAVTINGKPASPHQALKAGDAVTLERPTLPTEPTPAAAVPPDMPEVPVIAETDDYLVVDKPAGLLVHGDARTTEPTLAAWLISRFPAAAGVGDDPFRPGIVHRLDKDVSGLMVLCKTPAFFDHIKKQFQKRTLAKKYTAIACGKIARDQVAIDFPIERSASGHKMAARPKNQEGKSALSEVRVLKRLINYTLVKVTIKTGRTHQIRAHLAAYGNPILGDQLYGTSSSKKLNAKMETARIYLVSDELAFKDRAGQKQSFALELPQEFVKMLGMIK